MPNAAERLEQRALRRNGIPAAIGEVTVDSIEPGKIMVLLPGGIDDHAIDKPFNRREVIGVWLPPRRRQSDVASRDGALRDRTTEGPRIERCCVFSELLNRRRVKEVP